MASTAPDPASPGLAAMRLPMLEVTRVEATEVCHEKSEVNRSQMETTLVQVWSVKSAADPWPPEAWPWCWIRARSERR
jgi:hypothetical protein